MYNNNLVKVKELYSDIASTFNIETEQTNKLATETYNLLTNVTQGVTTLKNKISVLGDMLTDLRVLNGSAKNIIPLTNLKVIENKGIKIKDSKFELDYITNELKEIDANLSSLTSVSTYKLYTIDGKESYLNDLIKTKTEIEVKFPNKNFTFDLNLRYQTQEQINTIVLQLGLLTEAYPDILSIKYVDHENNLKDIIILDTNTRNYSLNDNRVKDNLYIFNITPVVTDQIIIQLASRENDSVLLKGIETYYSNILSNGYIILGPISTEDPILKLAVDSSTITEGIRIEVSTDKDYWIELNNSSSIGLNGTKKILSINTIGSNSIKNDQDIYSMYVKISIQSSVLSNENLDVSVYNTLREDSTIGNDLLNTIENIRLSAYRVSSSDYSYGKYMYNNITNLATLPLDRIEYIQNNGISKVLGLVDTKYSITDTNNTSNVTGSIGAELKLKRMVANSTLDADTYDVANCKLYDIYPRKINEIVNTRQKDNLCLMLKRDKIIENTGAIEPVVIQATYDNSNNVMTVLGDPGLEVTTRDSNDNVIGSGIIGSDGTVTYPLNVQGLTNGTVITTSAQGSNVVEYTLVDEVEPPVISCEDATDSLYLTILLNRVELGGKFTVYDAESNVIIVTIDGTDFLEAPDFVQALNTNINPDYVDKLDFITFAPTSYYADMTVQGIFQIKNIHTSNIRLNVDLRDMGSGQNNLTTLGILVLQPNTPALVFNENDFMESKYNLSACLAPNVPPIEEIPSNEMHFTTLAGSVDYVGTQGDQILLSDNSIVDITATDETFTFNVPSGKHKVKLVESVGRSSYVSVGGEDLVELHNFPTLSTVTKFNFTTHNYNSLPNLTKVPNVFPSNVTSMEGMFANASAFNQDISMWDVSSVTHMGGVFANASAFNQPLNNWNVSNVTNMEGMFYQASAFNQPLNNWNVSNVTNMYNMFSQATLFNQDISGWNVSNVTDMVSMFYQASAFNQPLNNWDVSNVTYMVSMFYQASAFNQDLSNWCVSNIPTMPTEFNTGAPFLVGANLPVWGTCPAP